jgi:hypothetical protein
LDRSWNRAPGTVLTSATGQTRPLTGKHQELAYRGQGFVTNLEKLALDEYYAPLARFADVKVPAATPA